MQRVLFVFLILLLLCYKVLPTDIDLDAILGGTTLSYDYMMCFMISHSQSFYINIFDDYLISNQMIIRDI